MRQVICDFRLECPEHNQAIEWQEMASVNQAVANFSLTGASSEDLARWHVVRAKQFLFSGQYENAVEQCGEALKLLSSQSDQTLLWYALYFKGIGLEHQHRYDEALYVLGEASSTATHINDERYRLYVLHAISELMTIKEQHGEALEYYREFHRLHQLLNVKSAEIKAQRDSLHIASANMNSKAGARAWQWQIVAGCLMLLLIGTAVYFRTAVARLSFDNRNSFRYEGTKMDRKPKPMFGFTFPHSEALTDEEILVDEAKVERLAALRNVRLLTQEDWELFENDFSQIYPDFLVKLRYVHPEISAAEEKLSCLLRIHYGTKDVARTLAISPQSVSVSRYRLRKRMGLPLETTLEEYIMSF